MENNKPSSNNNFPDKQTWGAREELLLACAVRRYGTENWSSVAVEVQKRSSKLQFLITPLACRQKFHDLKRHFSRNGAVSLTTDSKDNDNDAVSWLNELKKLRVAELKRELERYDLSIVSLQLKVRRLTEEREQSLTKNDENEPEKSDQVRTVERTGEEGRTIIENNGPESLTGKQNSGEDSDRANWSVNESNWTDPKAEGEEAEKESEPVKPVRNEPQHVVEDIKPAGEDSCNGSCGRVNSKNSERVDWAESKDDDNKERESGSDVQSAVKLSRKDEEEKSDQPDEPDNEEEEQSLAATVPKRRVSFESKPLIECLEIIRSHKFGPLFERLDVIMETPDYRTLIRQHIDLEMIRMRLEKNWYSGCSSSFFRDLLLLFDNAIVFFSKNSLESTAAIDLRQIVLKEIAGKMKTSDPNLPPKEHSATSPTAEIVKLELDSSDSLLSKRNILIPLIACRKRSSIAAKQAVSSSSVAEMKKEETSAPIDKNPVPDSKEHCKSSIKTDQETRVTKMRTRERFASCIRSSSRKGKSRNNHRGSTKTKKSSDANANASDNSSEEEESNSENSKTQAEEERNNKNKASINAKKRMKRSSPSRNDSLLETLKSSAISSKNGKGERAEQKNKNSSNGNVERKKEQIKQTLSGGKRGKETERESAAKRNEGQSTRRTAAAPPPPPAASRGKRRRDSVETEASNLGRTRKRSKK